jgi:hypothetical protein
MGLRENETKSQLIKVERLFNELEDNGWDDMLILEG